ncbi:hypothetical protein M0R72_16170 [Candidatus Pacearchaeota archaeon]|jgi:hypothetical protein|nr:hypothetical protein [Candidatus Pacearchaeota archaeon]
MQKSEFIEFVERIVTWGFIVNNPLVDAWCTIIFWAPQVECKSSSWGRWDNYRMDKWAGKQIPWWQGFNTWVNACAGIEVSSCLFV